jgi:hypothetical protein
MWTNAKYIYGATNSYILTAETKSVGYTILLAESERDILVMNRDTREVTPCAAYIGIGGMRIENKPRQ